MHQLIESGEFRSFKQIWIDFYLRYNDILIFSSHIFFFFYILGLRLYEYWLRLLAYAFLFLEIHSSLWELM